MKTKLGALAILIIFCVVPAKGTTDEDGLFAYVGAAADMGIPSSVRLGVASWEVGLLTGEIIGIDKLFRWDSHYYVAWGAGMVIGDTSGGGFYAALGWEPQLFWIFTFRAELNAVAGTNGLVKGGLYAGLGLHF